MPNYDYHCGDDGDFTINHPMSQSAVCPICGGKLQKVYHATPVHFKGRGFYQTDKK